MMRREYFFLFCAIWTLFYAATCVAQGTGGSKVRTRFTCQGRGAGYYADVETGCQVYHMCDGLGRQFSYTCPNTTLFQQRMLICDHWYMVNCSKSEKDYSANLLIGQRDKPFVSEEDMRLRTPRPDILSIPLNPNYYDGLREAESKYPVHPGNSIVGVADTILSSNNNGLDSDKQNYRPPTSWSTGTGVSNQLQTNNFNNEHDTLTGAASHEPTPTFQTTPDFNTRLPTPSPDLSLPLPDKTTTTEAPSSEVYDIDVRMKTTAEDPVYNFIKRFDPNSPDSHKTAMSRSEIIDLNKHLPTGQASAEEDRTPRKHKNVGNDNTLSKDNGKGFTEGSRFDTVNLKPPTPTLPTVVTIDESSHAFPTPDRELQPPKKTYSEQPSTTMGPPVYYEWKWAVPAYDLEPPKESNVTNNNTAAIEGKSVKGRSPFSDVTRPTPVTVDPTPSNTEYNISSYFVPDYVFPLDKPHPGYEDENAETSFQVKIGGRTGRSNFGENPNCPQCHPTYLKPGTCQRDKPFVSEEDMRLRTPRPDILSIPLNPNYYDGLREAESKYPVHPGNSIVGVADTILSSNNNGLDSDKQNYRPPTSWSTGTGVSNQLQTNNFNNEHDTLTGAASHEPTPTFQTTPDFNTRLPTPSPDLSLPLPDKTTTTEAPSSEVYDIDVRMKTTAEDPVYNFIKRFDPNSPDSHKTAMSRSEIIDLNKHLPTGQASAEEDRTPRKYKNVGNDNTLSKDNGKGFTERSRFDTVNLKPTTPTLPTVVTIDESSHAFPTPDRELQPPKKTYSEQPSTTMGPPVYYEWKWAVPAYDLEPPKESNVTNNNTAAIEGKSVKGRSPFSDVTRPTPVTVDPTPSNTEYNISSYFVPDYVFPLDKPHPGYEDENAETSFQVKIGGRTGRSNFGENPNCPQCHPTYLKPGTCEPCIVKR